MATHAVGLALLLIAAHASPEEPRLAALPVDFEVDLQRIAPEPAPPPQPPPPPRPQPAPTPPDVAPEPDRQPEPPPLPEEPLDEIEPSVEAPPEPELPSDLLLPEMTEPVPEAPAEQAAPAEEEPADGVVAVYAEGAITRDELAEFIRARFGFAPDQWQGEPEAKLELALRFLYDMVLRRMAAKRARELGLANQPWIQRAIQSAAEDETIVRLAETLGLADIEVSDQEIAQYYADHSDQFADVSLETARPYMEAILRHEKAAKALEDYLAQLRAGARISTNYAILEDPAADELEPVFTIDDESFTLADLRDVLDDMSPDARLYYDNPDHQVDLLEDIINRRLLVRAAESMQDPALRDRIAMLEEDILAGALRHELVDKNVVVTDEEVSALYERVKRNMTTMPRARIAYARIVGIRDEESWQQAVQTLSEVRDEVNAGTAWEDVRTAHEQAGDGIEFSENDVWVQEGSHDLLDLLPTHRCNLCRAVFGTDVGKASDPFALARGVACVVAVLELEPGKTPPLQAVSPILAMDLWDAKQAEGEAMLNRQLLDDAQLQVREKNLRAMVGADQQPPQPQPSEVLPTGATR